MRKSGNGQAKGSSYLLSFDLDDEAERRAWKVMQSLASERKLKRTLLGFLLALDEIQLRSGKVQSVEEMMGRFITSIIMGGSAGQSAPALSIGDYAEDAPLIIGSVNHADPEQARDQLALGMGSLFDDS